MNTCSCNTSTKKFPLRAPLVSFLTPKRHFGTQTSYHSSSTVILWTSFQRNVFQRRISTPPRKRACVTGLYRGKAQTINGTPRSRIQTSCHPDERPAQGTLNMRIRVGAKSKVLLCAPVRGTAWSVYFSLVRLCKGESNRFWQICPKRRKPEWEPLVKAPLGPSPAALVTFLSTCAAIARANARLWLCTGCHCTGKFKARVKHFSAATWRWRDEESSTRKN